jgi:DGQHR domain-containing protein
MKFFFAENCDSVDPNFDFIWDHPTQGRNRSHDLFAHEELDSPPYDGLLASRSLIEGTGSSKRYSQAQKYRVLCQGLRAHFRYPKEGYSGDPFDFPIMGDCGSFSYVDQRIPPYSAEDTLEFYCAAGVQFGVAPDHIILDHNPLWDKPRLLPLHIEERHNFTLRTAEQFLKLTQKGKSDVVPIGAIQCWSAGSAARNAVSLVRMGYKYLGLGGLVSRKTNQIYEMVSEIRNAIPPDVRLHLFGFSRIDDLESFSNLGIDSFDSTSPMLKSFKDDEFNYFDEGGKHLTAIRIPPREDPKVKRRIQSGLLDGEKVRELEEHALSSVREFEAGEKSLDDTLESIYAYESMLRPEVDFRETYRKTLEREPWKHCPCAVCQKIGIEVVLHRNLNRHKRRGFHNLYVLHKKVMKLRHMKTISLPCLRIEQGKGRYIYSFAVDGKDIQKFASISRIGRGEGGKLEGYQRPEILTHISDIRRYLEQAHAVLPNALIIAFSEKLAFTAVDAGDGASTLGHLEIPIGSETKPGWVVDGQQRLAALRQMSGRSITVPVTAIESLGVEDEREQFVLINNTRPLPKSLVYELLPSLGDSIPPKFRLRQAAYNVLEILATDPDSPFCGRIKTTTSIHLPTANIKDVSVLRMIENSVDNGVLARVAQTARPQAKLLIQYWNSVKEVFPEAWILPPRESRLTHGAGIISMGFLMDAIAFRLKQSNRILATHNFRCELDQIASGLAWTEGSWELGPGISIPWKEIQNTGRHIDLITNYLIRRYREVAV